MNTINLSYLVCTCNRLKFLKILLPKVVDALQADEELIVVDGNSTDGSKAYLQQLYNEGKIHQFISEPDHNQAHGWNKGLLMARGTIIKKLIDDDVHDFEAIRKCRDFMLENPQKDICISNHLESALNTPGEIRLSGRLPEFEKWSKMINNTFSFSDVTMLLRRSALSFIGLYDTQFTMLDWEYSLRASYLRAGIAYYTGCNSLAVSTPGNITSTVAQKRLAEEGKIGQLKYKYVGDQADISTYSHFKIFIGTFLDRLKKTNANTTAVTLPSPESLQVIYGSYYKKLNDYNAAGKFDFIY